MSKTTKFSAVNVQIDSSLKEKATMVLDELGLSMSTAVNLFLKQVVKTESIPFEITNAKPSKRVYKVILSKNVKENKNDKI